MEGDLTQPTVVVIQEIWGVNSHIQSVTDRLPSQGYVGLAPALFHREGRMTLGLYEEMEPALARLGRCTDANIIADVKAAVAYLKAQPFVDPQRIGIVGFWFGVTPGERGDGPRAAKREEKGSEDEGLMRDSATPV
jgi:carboxymethylenebutenolidase